MYKKNSCLLKLLTTIILLLTHHATLASEPQQIIITGFGKNALLPFHWFNYCTNEMEGSNVQLVKWVFKELGIQVNLTESFVSGQADFDALRNGEVDAIFAVSAKDMPGIIKIKTPIITLGLSIFYPAHLGSLQNIKPLQQLPGIYLMRAKGLRGDKLVKEWANANQLNITMAPDQATFDQASQSIGDHFIVRYQYREGIDRSQYNILKNRVANSVHYFALADRSPWKEMLPLIEERFEFAKASGLTSLLKETSFKRWLKEKHAINACKKSIEVK